MNLPDLINRMPGARRSGHGYVAHCPSHEDRHKSLSIGVAEGRILLHCFAGCDFRDILAALGRCAADLRVGAGAKQTGPSTQDRIRYARQLWEESRAIVGSVAEKYLREARAITCALPRCLRFLPLLKHREYGWRFPCICAGIQAFDGKFAGVSVTWLCADGMDKAPVDPARKVFGILRGGAVRVGPPRETVVLCEGVETGLSLAQACPELPVWCALSASNLTQLELPPSVREVIVAADADEAGEAAARAASRHFVSEGRRVLIARTGRARADFNDLRL